MHATVYGTAHLVTVGLPRTPGGAVPPRRAGSLVWGSESPCSGPESQSGGIGPESGALAADLAVKTRSTSQTVTAAAAAGASGRPGGLCVASMSTAVELPRRGLRAQGPAAAPGRHGTARTYGVGRGGRSIRCGRGFPPRAPTNAQPLAHFSGRAWNVRITGGAGAGRWTGQGQHGAQAQDPQDPTPTLRAGASSTGGTSRSDRKRSPAVSGSESEHRSPPSSAEGSGRGALPV